MEKAREELADVITYSLSLANTLGIDVSEAVKGKLKKNAEKSNTPAWPEYDLQTGILAIHYAKYPAGL